MVLVLPCVGTKIEFLKILEQSSLLVSVSIYLMSRFLIMTAHTREFPIVLVIMIMDFTAVKATSADSDITEGC